LDPASTALAVISNDMLEITADIIMKLYWLTADITEPPEMETDTPEIEKVDISTFPVLAMSWAPP
jgi:hypothetical protein